jgi:anti-anti-sigma factor
MQLLRTVRTDEALLVEGEIDVAVESEMALALDDAIGAGTTVVDLSGVTFMGSVGLRVLLGAGAKMNGDGPLVLLRPSPHVRRILDVALPTGAPGIEVRDV